MARRCHMRLAARPPARRRPKGRQPSAKPRRSRPLPGGVFARGDRPMRMKHLQKFYSNNRRHSLVILERAVTPGNSVFRKVEPEKGDHKTEGGCCSGGRCLGFPGAGVAAARH